MPPRWFPVLLSAILCGILGLMLYQLGADEADPAMNPLGVVSFASLGACLGCLLSPPRK